MSDRELIEQLIRLQITQTAALTRLLEANLNRIETVDIPVASVLPQEPDPNRPFEIGDSVTILTTGRFRIRRDTVCTVVKVSARITVETPAGVKIIRAPHNLRRVAI